MGWEERRSMALGSQKLLDALKAFSDGNRLQILASLRDGRKCVQDLTGAVDCGQSLVSFHLRTLLDAGLIDVVPRGRFHCYSIRREAFEELELELAELRDAAAAVRPGGPADGTCCPGAGPGAGEPCVPEGVAVF